MAASTASDCNTSLIDRVPSTSKLDETSLLTPFDQSCTPSDSQDLTKILLYHQAKQFTMLLSGSRSKTQGGSDFKGENYAMGKGLGIISAKYFERATWTPLLKNPMGQQQYGRFITLMIGRIILQESNADEVRRFVNLVASELNEDLMKYAVQYMPDWHTEAPRDVNNFQLALCFQQMRIRLRQRFDLVARREYKSFERKKLELYPGNSAYQDSLHAEEKVRRLAYAPISRNTQPEPLGDIFVSRIQFGFCEETLSPLPSYKASETVPECDILRRPFQLRYPESSTDELSSPTTVAATQPTVSQPTATSSTIPTFEAGPSRIQTSPSTASQPPSHVNSWSTISDKPTNNDDPVVDDSFETPTPKASGQVSNNNSAAPNTTNGVVNGTIVQVGFPDEVNFAARQRTEVRPHLSKPGERVNIV